MPADRRKASNRRAQRAFRERKRQKLDLLQEELTRERQERQERERHEAERRIKEQQERARLQQQILALQAQALAKPEERQDMRSQDKKFTKAEAQQQLRSFSIPPRSEQFSFDGIPTPSSARSPGIISPGSVLPLPDSTRNGDRHDWMPNVKISQMIERLPQPNQPSHKRTESKVSEPQSPYSLDDMEIDFTTRPMEHTNDPVDEPCGFCTADTYCVCRDKPVSPPTIDKLDSTGRAGAPLEPTVKPTGPGTCASCMEDPVRRKMCMDIARKHSGTTRPLPSIDSRMTETNETPSLQRMQEGPSAWPSSGWVSCADAITMARSADPNLPNSPQYDEWVQGLRTAPPKDDRSCKSCDGRHCSAQDVEIASILQGMRSDPSPGIEKADVKLNPLNAGSLSSTLLSSKTEDVKMKDEDTGLAHVRLRSPLPTLDQLFLPHRRERIH